MCEFYDLSGDGLIDYKEFSECIFGKSNVKGAMVKPSQANLLEKYSSTPVNS